MHSNLRQTKNIQNNSKAIIKKQNPPGGHCKPLFVLKVLMANKN